MKNIPILGALVVALLLFAGCTSSPVQNSNFQDGQNECRGMVNDNVFYDAVGNINTRSSINANWTITYSFCMPGTSQGQNINYRYCNFNAGHTLLVTDEKGNIVSHSVREYKVSMILEPIGKPNELGQQNAQVIDVKCTFTGEKQI